MTKNYLTSFKNIISNLYNEPKTSAQLETQCFFGEKFEVFEEYKAWIRGKLLTDNYIGWVEKKIQLNISLQIKSY